MASQTTEARFPRRQAEQPVGNRDLPGRTRRLGMMPAKTPRKGSQGGDRKLPATMAVETLRQLGIDRKQAARWQVAAKSPEQESAEWMEDARKHAAEIGQRAERALGEMLADMDTRTVGRRARNRSQDVTDLPPPLSDLSIRRMQSSRWQTRAPPRAAGNQEDDRLGLSLRRVARCPDAACPGAACRGISSAKAG